MNNPILNSSYAWFFDIDGVITNPQTKRVTKPKIIEIIAEKLHNHEPVIFITGRPLEWVRERVLSLLGRMIKNKDDFNYIYVSGEFGRSFLWYENGVEKTFVDTKFSLAKELVEEAEKATEEFSDVMLVDHQKKTHFTAEMKDGVDIEQVFRPKQRELVKNYQEIVKGFALENELEVHADRIATNIKNKKANKAHATDEALKWLKKKNIKVKKYIAFGDSRSDVEIAEELYRHKLPVTFVFVGEKEQIRDMTLPFEVVITKEKCEKGTMEYFKE